MALEDSVIGGCWMERRALMEYYGWGAKGGTIVLDGGIDVTWWSWSGLGRLLVMLGRMWGCY